MYLQLLLWIVTIYCFHLGHLSILSKYYKRMMQVVTFPPLLPNVASYFHLKPPLACYYYLVLLCFAWFLLSSFCICCAANAVSIFVSSSFTSTLKTYQIFFMFFGSSEFCTMTGWGMKMRLKYEFPNFYTSQTCSIYLLPK